MKLRMFLEKTLIFPEKCAIILAVGDEPPPYEMFCREIAV